MLHNNTTMEMDELHLYTAIDSYNHNAAEKKPYTKEFLVYDFKYIKFKNKWKCLYCQGTNRQWARKNILKRWLKIKSMFYKHKRGNGKNV